MTVHRAPDLITLMPHSPSQQYKVALCLPLFHHKVALCLPLFHHKVIAPCFLSLSLSPNLKVIFISPYFLVSFISEVPFFSWSLLGEGALKSPLPSSTKCLDDHCSNNNKLVIATVEK